MKSALTSKMGRCLSGADILGVRVVLPAFQIAVCSMKSQQDNSGCMRAVKVIPMWRMQLDNKKEEMRAELEHEIEVTS